MSRMPHRQDPRDPWTEHETTSHYLHRPAEPGWPDLWETDPPEPSGLLGPNGAPLPGPERAPFGFQLPARPSRPAPRRGQRRKTR